MTEPDSLPRPPEPLSAPTAVTGWKPAERGGRGRLWIVLVAVLGVAALTGAGVLAVRFVRDRVVLPLARDYRIGSELTTRALSEYPGYTYAGIETLVVPGAAGEMSPVTQVLVTLTAAGYDGFTYAAAYAAPSAVAGDPEAYENYDGFFRTPVSPGQPTHSFITMWMDTRPMDACDYVIETGESFATTRTYEVGHSHPARVGVETKLKIAYYEYVTATDVWTETPMPEDATAALEESVVDTATAVARALPSFEVAGVAQMPNGSWVSIIRHRKSPKLRIVVETRLLTRDDWTDSAVMMFGHDADPTRAKAFIRAWTAAHPRAIIDYIFFDPDFEDRNDIVDVSYADSVDDVGVYGKEETVRLRYTKKHTWVPAK